MPGVDLAGLMCEGFGYTKIRGEEIKHKALSTGYAKELKEQFCQHKLHVK
jgi:hypothetical protein